MKNTIFLMLLGALMVIAGCSKKKSDFRDSLTGNYAGAKHYHTYSVDTDALSHTPHSYTTDTILETLNITVTKGSDDSSLNLNGNLFTFYKNDNTHIMYGSPNVTGVPNSCYFTLSNDSIWFEDRITFQAPNHTEYTYTGRKQ